MSFAVKNLAKFSSNSGKVYFKGLVHLFRYIRENNNLRLKYYDDIKDAPLSDLLRKASINTDNQLMVFSDYSCKYFPYTGRSTVAHIIFIKVGQLTMTHMFHDQLFNQVHKVITMYNALQEWL